MSFYYSKNTTFSVLLSLEMVHKKKKTVIFIQKASRLYFQPSDASDLKTGAEVPEL